MKTSVSFAVCIRGAAVVAGSADCDFDRVDGGLVDTSTVRSASRPFVLTGVAASWHASSLWPSADAFVALHGNTPGYARDHDQLEILDVDTTVAEYLSAANSSGSSSAFFVNDYEDSRFLDRIDGEYAAPSALQHIGQLRVAAVERPATGVTFHAHEEAWQALVVGRKRWFLAPPSVEAVPQHSPCSFDESGGSPPPMAETCTLEAGEAIYLPSGWWHATCSLSPEPSVAIGAVGLLDGWPPALLAARRGDEQALLVIRALDSVDTTELPRRQGTFIGGERPLFIACSFGRVAAVEALLARGASPNAQRRDGRTSLHEAARRGDMAIIEMLLNAGGDIGAVDAQGSTVLHHACSERGRSDVVEFLLAHGASSSQKRADGRTAMHVACRGHSSPVPVLRALLQTGQAEPAPRDGSGATPLMLCAAAGHRRAVGLLVRLAASASIQDDSGIDALGYAIAGRCDKGVVTRLLAEGLRPGENASATAARLGSPSVLRLLSEAGAPLTGVLAEAAQNGHGDIIRMAGELEIDVNFPESESGATPIHLASLAGQAGALRELLAVGARADAVDNDGLTAMHYVVASQGRGVRVERRREIAEALGRAAPELWSRGATTPLQLAAASGDLQLAILLAERVGDVSAALAAADDADEESHADVARALRTWAADAERLTDRGEL